MKRVLSCALALALAACSGSDGSEAPKQPPTLAVTPSTAALQAGGAGQVLTAVLRNATTGITWSASPAGVGTLSASAGTTTTYTPPEALAGEATVTVTATSGALTASAVLTVAPPPAPSLTLSPEVATLTAGGEGLEVTATLSHASGAITWTATPAGVGTLSPASGASVTYTPPEDVAAPTVVTLTANAAGLTATCTVTVNPPPALTVTPTSATVTAGGAGVLVGATLVNSSDPITWALAPAGVGSLSGLTGASTTYQPPATVAAATDVTVTASAAGRTATAIITVNPPDVPTLTITRSASDTAAGGANIQLTATPGGGATGTVTWSTPAVGTLTASGNEAVYVPPAALAEQTTVELSATLPAAALVAQTSVTVHPPPSVSLPATAAASFGGGAVALAAVAEHTSGPAVFSVVSGAGTVTSTGNTGSYTPPPACTTGAEAATVRATVPGHGGTSAFAETVVTVEQAGTLALSPAAIDVTAGDPDVTLTATLAGGATGLIAWMVREPNTGSLAAATGGVNAYHVPAAGRIPVAAPTAVVARAGCLWASVPVTVRPAPGDAVDVFPPEAVAVPGGRAVRFETRLSSPAPAVTFELDPPIGTLVQDGEDAVYTAPAAVAATQVITLVAHAGTATTTVPITLAGPEGISVEGFAYDYAAGRGVPGLRVLLGGELKATDAQGLVTFEHVHPPYDLVNELDPGSYYVMQGLTVDRLLLQTSSSSHGATISGHVTNRTAGYTTRVGSALNAQATAAEDGGYTAFHYWSGRPETTTTLRALEWQPDAAGLPITFGGYGSAEAALTDGGTTTLDLALSVQAGTAQVSGSTALPPGHGAHSVSGWVRFPGHSFLLPAYAAPNTWAYPVPVLDGTSLIVRAAARDADGNTTTATRYGQAPGASGLGFDLAPAPVITAPAAGATDVGDGTTFSWTGAVGYRYVYLYPSAGVGPYLYLWADGDSVTLPDLSPFGVTLPSGEDYRFRLYGYADDRYTWNLDGVFCRYYWLGSNAGRAVYTALRTVRLR